MNKFTLGLTMLLVITLHACSTDNPDAKMELSKDFEPVYPLAAERPKVASGSIYANGQSDAWFGRGRNYKVGDLITVLLNESTQSARNQNSQVNRDATTSLPTGLNTQLGKASPLLNGIDLTKNAADSKSTGSANQNASLTGSVAVTVVEILANGNLVVRGEKKLGLSEGTEVIQVSGVLRPADIGPNDQVQSWRLANAQFAYRGTGDLSNAAKVGWGTSLMHKYWPF